MQTTRPPFVSIPAVSCFLRDDDSKTKAERGVERAWMDGSQVNHRGVDPSLRNAPERMELDIEAMYELRMTGVGWREVGRAFGVSANTAHDRVLEIYPRMPRRVSKGGDQ